MPSIELTDAELQQAAQGARMGALQAEKDAAQYSSQKCRATFEPVRSVTGGLAAKLAQARKSARLR